MAGRIQNRRKKNALENRRLEQHFSYVQRVASLLWGT
jgi:hypothetical protein